MQPYVLEMRNIVKKYGVNTVLHKVDFDLREGEVHVLVGANGAGKSTLVKIISGVTPLDEGSITLFGKQQSRFQSPKDAFNSGISYVSQEPSLIQTLPVAENLFLGKEPRKFSVLIDQRKIYREAKKVLRHLDFPIDVGKITAQLTAAEQKMVEIARSISTNNSRILILDEPTATLTHEESKQLFVLIKRLQSQGVGIIYITHHLDELKLIGDRITVLRDGKKAGTFQAQQIDEKQLIVSMMGEVVQTSKRMRKPASGQVLLDLRNDLQDSFLDKKKCHVHKGEIVVFFGLTGSGRTELLYTLAGRSRNQTFNKKVLPKLKKQGITYIPDDRKNKGIIANRSILDNISISNLNKYLRYKLLLNIGDIQRHAELLSEQLKIKMVSLEQSIRELSGGNQQKVLFARAMFSEAAIMIIDDPTVGVDVNARSQIHQLLFDLSRQGKTILIGTSDENEACLIADRVYVLYQGAIVKELTGDDISKENVLSYASGVSMKGGE